MFRVLLVDDHPMLRLGLKTALKGRSTEICAEAGSAAEALSVLEKETEIDLVLLDIDLPGEDGLEILKQLRRRHPQTRVIMFSHHRSKHWIEQALELGASGFLSKDDRPETICSLIESAMDGHVILSPTIQSAFYGSTPAPSLDSLTARETEVFQLLVHGFKHKDIADRLNITVRTVDFHKQNIKDKLEAESLVDLVRIAQKYGL
jgi:DNA-binding NarL/FixJ family response regulator